MRVLIDTQCWLWMNVSPERLSERTHRTLLARSTERLFSVASIWEIAIKYQLGKLPLPLAPADYVPDRLRLTRTEPLAITPIHALRAGSLPPLHRDPFDRMVVAQALAEELPVLSSDSQLDAYGIRRLVP
jgi:PIN domain nuclease of toxin-antitoxin system